MHIGRAGLVKIRILLCAFGFREMIPVVQAPTEMITYARSIEYLMWMIFVTEDE